MTSLLGQMLAEDTEQILLTESQMMLVNYSENYAVFTGD